MSRITRITFFAGALQLLLIVALGVILAVAATHAHPDLVPLNQQLHSIVDALTMRPTCCVASR